MVSVGLNYILQVAFELRESQWAQRLALSLTFSPYTFQSSTLTSVTTLLPCWKLGYRVCFNLAENLSHCRDKRGAINSTELRWRYLQLYIYLLFFLWPPSHLSFILLEIFISVVALKRYNYFVSALLKHGHLNQLQLQVWTPTSVSRLVLWKGVNAEF